MRISLYGLVALIALGTGCATGSQQDRVLAPRAGESLMYFRDARTGLCFAGEDFWNESTVLTNVPCTPEVQRLIAYHNQPPANPPAP